MRLVKLGVSSYINLLKKDRSVINGTMASSFQSKRNKKKKNYASYTDLYSKVIN